MDPRMRKVVNFMKFYEKVHVSWKVVFSQKSCENIIFNINAFCCKNLPQNHWYSLGISYFSSSGRREPLFSRNNDFHENMSSIGNCKHHWKQWFPMKFHDFPRTCSKSSWRLMLLAYFGSDFCQKLDFHKKQVFAFET